MKRCTHRTSVSDSCAPGGGGWSSPPPALEAPRFLVGEELPILLRIEVILGWVSLEIELDDDALVRLENKGIVSKSIHINTSYSPAPQRENHANSQFILSHLAAHVCKPAPSLSNTFLVSVCQLEVLLGMH